jgi:hypothetical protein
MKSNGFNFARLLVERKNGVKHNPLSNEILEEGRESFERSGIPLDAYKGNFLLPIQSRAVLESGTSNEDISKSFIFPALSEKLILVAAGATFLPDLPGSISLPTQSGITVAWKGQHEAPVSEGAGSIGFVDFSATGRLTAFYDIPMTALVKASKSPTLDQWLLNNMITKVAEVLERTVLGVAARDSDAPQGMGYKCTTGTDTKAAAVAMSLYAAKEAVITLEKKVDDNGALKGKLAYITSGKGSRLLKTNRKENGFPESLLEKGLLNDYPVFASSVVSDIAGSDAAGSLLVFGNWQDLVIAQFGGYDVIVDYITLARLAQVRITVHSFFDVKGARGSVSTGIGTDADEYGLSFASMAIK